MPVIKTLQINFIEINPWANIVEYLRRGVAVGDERGFQSCCLGFFENSDGPLGRNQRLIVGTYEDFCALVECIAHQQLRRSLQRWRDRLRVAQGLRGNPVLAIGAVQVTAQHAKAVSQGSRVSVEKRLLLDRIALHSAHISPGHVQGSTLVVADLAYSGLSLSNGAAVPARKAANTIPLNRLVEVALSNVLIEDYTRGRQATPLPTF